MSNACVNLFKLNAARHNPGELECAISPFFGMRTVNTNELDAYVEAGATHFILGMSRPALDMPWNFERVEQLLEWRNSKRK